MSSSIDNNSRIAKNTLYLYSRMFLTMAIALYTSRIVLQVLGASDYGLYSVVGGIVTMFSMFSSSLVSGTQRFLTFSIGEKNNEKLKKVFSVALLLDTLVALFLMFFAEVIGMWFLNTQMTIPEGRMFAAICVFQISVLTFCLHIIQIPFMSSIIAHEDMHIYAYMSIYEVIMKLLIVFLIQSSNSDKLIFYAVLVFAVQCSTFILYCFYCKRKYRECILQLTWNKALFKEMLTFNGWSILGGASGFASGQGINLLLNVFFDTVVNAAKGISSTINNYVAGFVTNFQMAANPQIVKLYAAKENDQLYSLIVNNSRAAGYLFLVIAIPVSLEISHILGLWLGEYPQYTEIFTILVFLQSFPYSIDRPLVTLINATGKVKWYNLTSGIWILLILPVGYVLLKMGCTPVAPCLACALMWMIQLFWTAIFANRYSKIPMKLIFKDIYINVFIGGILMLSIPLLVRFQMPDGWLRFIIVCCISGGTSLLVLYFWGMTPGMKKFFLSKVCKH